MKSVESKTMTDAPERIWIKTDDPNNRPFVTRGPLAAPPYTEYVRADLAKPDWQPIETAPKGEELLVGVWVDQDISRRWSVWVAYDEFCSGDYGNDGEYGDTPTHWMYPLTPPE